MLSGIDQLGPGSNSRHLLFSARLISDPSRHANHNKHVTISSSEAGENGENAFKNMKHNNASKCTNPGYI